MNVKYPEIRLNYDFPGIANLGLGFKIIKIIFRVSFEAFYKAHGSFMLPSLATPTQ